MFKDSPEGQTQYEPAAPEPVAWMGEYHTNDIRDHYTVVMRHKTDFDGVPDRVQPLYSAVTVERLVQERDDYKKRLLVFAVLLKRIGCTETKSISIHLSDKDYAEIESILAKNTEDAIEQARMPK